MNDSELQLDLERARWILIRGLVREAAHWGVVPDIIEKATPNAVVSFCDLPGNGVLHRRKTPLRVEALARHVDEVTQPHDDGPTIVLGMSLGAMVTFAWLHASPNAADAAIVVNPSVGNLSPIHHRLKPRAYPLVLRSLVGRHLRARESAILDMTANAPNRQDHLDAWLSAQEARPVTRANAVRQLLAASRYRLPTKPPSTPVLLMNGAGDRLVDPRCSTAIHEATGVPMVVHPDAGHDLSIDAPKWMIETSMAWLRGEPV